MAESVYKVIELIGTSTESWEKAAAAAISRASQTLRDLRVAEVSAAGSATQGWQSGIVPREGKSFIQVRGLIARAARSASRDNQRRLQGADCHTSASQD